MAYAQWEPDGTQPPEPQQTWADPVAGLVTGSTYQPEPITVHVPESPMPDVDEVRRAVDAVFGVDEPMRAAAPPKAARRGLSGPTGTTPGMVPPPNPRPGWPRSPSSRQLARMRAKTPTADRHRPAPIAPARPLRRAQGFSAGIGGVVVLIVVIIVIIVTIISSLIETINSILK